MALVLLSSVPSGDARVVDTRHRIQAHISSPSLPSLLPGSISLHHSSAQGPFSGHRLYIGFGFTDPQSRPSCFANPFEFLQLDMDLKMQRFEHFLQSRADLSWYLRPLCGKELVCDCSHPDNCHGATLIRYVTKCFHPPDPPAVQPVSQACDHKSSFESIRDEPDDSGEDDTVVGTEFRPEDWHTVDETLRGRPQPRQERPAWPSAWTLLVSAIRTAQILLFWEIFSGTAGLSAAFDRADWTCAPPLDIMFDSSYNLMDPSFVCIVLGLILEKRFKLIHLGPPCSSFSMAVNRFPMHAMRSWLCPDGLSSLSSVQSDKVALGNALARVAIFIATAQLSVGMHFCLEQPESSLMWRFTPMAEFILAKSLLLFTFHACAFGAPWKKPTTILTNLLELYSIQRRCRCQRPHQVLAGKAPNGQNWTAVASPYWPELTDEWANLCSPIRPQIGEGQSASSNLAGFGFDDSVRPLNELLDEMAFTPSGKTSTFLAAARIAAGVQSSKRSVPTILPEFLGPENHLACAKLLQHPFARAPPLSSNISRALELHRIHGDSIASYREQLSELCKLLLDATCAENERLVKSAHPWLKPVLGKRNVRFMVEFNYIIGYEDHDLFCDYTFGLPMLGLARHSPVLVQRVSPMQLPMDLHDHDLETHNKSILDSIRPSKSPELDTMAWSKSQEDFNNGGLLGPFYSMSIIISLLGGLLPRLIRRFAILEQHGGAEVKVVESSTTA